MVESKETDEEHDEDCVEEGFQLARVKFNIDGEGGNIWDGSELKLSWSKKSSSYFENSSPIFLLSGFSNTSIFKVRDVLHWVNFLVMKK